MASILKVTEITTPDGTGNITVSRPLTGGTGVKGGDIASASPLLIDTDGDYFDVTGTTGFAAMTVAADRQFTLQFDGALTMTHHATNLDLPSEANITTAAGDVAVFQSTGANTVQCINYTKADGTGVVAAGGGKVLQVQSAQYATETETSSTTYADTGITVNITPANTANSIVVIANVAGCAVRTTHLTMALRLMRDAATIATQSGLANSGDTNTHGIGTCLLTEVDEPSTTSAVTYKVQYKSDTAAAAAVISQSNSESGIIVMEIDGT